jgi:alkylation response protein AidB-like acyl-CoA dehydrogenase
VQIAETEDQRLLREAIRIFVEHEAPADKVDVWEAEKAYPTAVFEALAEQGYLGLPFEESVGGGGYGAVEMAIIGEELAKPGLDIAGGYGLTVFAGLNLVRHGSEDQVARHIPAMLRGEERYALGITEPDAGSDVAGIKTRARRSEGGGYVISGQKVFTTGAGIPGTLIHVLARTGPPGRDRDGLSVFLVPNDAPGLELRRLETVGRHMLGTYETFYDDVEVPESALLGAEGDGWEVVTSSLELERVFAAAQYAGAARAVIALTARYVSERQQFGRALSSFQTVSHRLADALVEVEGARLLAYRAANAVEAGRANTEAAMAKLAASEAFQRATELGMQLFGGYGYMKEYRIERYWREARVTTVTAGASEIQRSIIARDMLRGRALV